MLNTAQRLLQSFYDPNRPAYGAGIYKAPHANRGTPRRLRMGKPKPVCPRGWR
jgi:hypothetical protein